ncbi:MAG TPA: glycerophosphodiester phosphodiesterase family protein [Cyclobacteriaceae bacterium]|nr:glycerophosphodiester phosphodiesterase family protein [Cyclobacteriaceae bacterium]
MLKIAHRGASGYELENSMSAFKKAIELGVDLVELDLQLTKDDQLVVFHDYALDRCTNSKGLIADVTLADLRKNVLLKNGEKIPTLTEVCDLFADHDVPLLVELKNTNTAAKAYKELISKLSGDDFSLGSFFHKQIYNLKSQWPDASTCIMFESYPIDLTIYLKKLKVDYVAAGFESTTPEMVDEIRKANVKSLVWTVNTVEDIREAKKMNVDGIISNYPDRIG